MTLGGFKQSALYKAIHQHMVTPFPEVRQNLAFKFLYQFKNYSQVKLGI